MNESRDLENSNGKSPTVKESTSKTNLGLTTDQKKRNDSDGNLNVGDSNEFNTEASRKGAFKDQTETDPTPDGS